MTRRPSLRRPIPSGEPFQAPPAGQRQIVPSVFQTPGGANPEVLRSKASEITPIVSPIENVEVRTPDDLLPLVYHDLRYAAAQLLVREAPGQTLQPTALVHEAWLRLTPVGTNWVVTTIAGTVGVAGSADATNSTALFNSPHGVAMDGAGNVYVADLINNTIRKVAPVGTNWVVTTIAGQPGVTGSADGTNSAAQFNWPVGVAVDSAGNLYVADYYNSTIRKVAPVDTNWVVTTIAGQARVAGSAHGTNNAARFYNPHTRLCRSRELAAHLDQHVYGWSAPILQYELRA